MSRLVFLCPDAPGGVRSYVSNLSLFLTKKSIDHAVILYGYCNRLVTRKSIGDLPHSTRILFSKYGTAGSANKDLAALIGKEDILICNDAPELEAVSYNGLKNRIIFVLHGDLRHYDAILKRYETLIDEVFCVSEGLKAKYSRIYTGIPFTVCYPMVRNYSPEINYNEKAPLKGVFIGRFEHLKGADTFLKVVLKAADTGLSIEWRVFATSKGSDMQLLAGLPPSVGTFFDLPNDKLLESIEGADFLLFPSRSEGFGMAVLECMKRAIVPIARNIPIGIPDMVKDGESGYLVEDVDDSLLIIKKLDRDRAGLHRMKEKTTAFAAAHFDYERSGERFITCIGEAQQKALRPDKAFPFHKPRFVERIAPESLYRILKYVHNTIKRRK